MVLLYPNLYQVFGLFILAIILFIASIPIYAVYTWIRGRMPMEQFMVLKKILFLATGILAVFLLIGVSISLVKYHQVNVQLGFRYATPDLPEGEVFLITSVEAGSAMELAGLRKNDRVQMGSVDDLYSLLINNQGNEVSFNVKRNEKIVTIDMVVPEMDIWQFKLVPFARY